MSQPESRLSRRIIQALNNKGAFAFKIHGGPTMMAGLPDVIVCANGRFIGLEVKMPSQRGNVSAVQHLVHGKIVMAMGIAVVVCSVNEALQVCGFDPE